MQNNNNNSNFDRVVNAIKKEESVKKKLSLFIKHIPVFFRQRKNLIEILEIFGYIGFLKALEGYDFEKKAKNDLDCDAKKAFINSTYAPFMTLTQNGEKKVIIEEGSPILNVFHLLLDDNKNTKVKLSDFDGLKKSEIVDGLYNLFKEGIFKSIKELKRYCDKDLDSMLVCVSLVLARGANNLNKNVLDINDKDAKIKLSDIEVLTESQIDCCLFNLIDNDLIDSLDGEKYFDKDLNYVFGISLFKSFIEPDKYPKLNELKLKEKNGNGELNTFFKVLKNFLNSRGPDINSRIKSSDLPGLSGPQLAKVVYDLIHLGLIENYDKLMSCFDLGSKSILRSMIGEVFLSLSYDYLDFCFEPVKYADNSKIISKFNINTKVVGCLFERYISSFTGVNVANFDFSFSEFQIDLFVNEFINSIGGMEKLDPGHVMKYIVLRFRSKGFLTEKEKIFYLKLLDKVIPSDSASSKTFCWDSNSGIKLFMFLCANGAWGFYMGLYLGDFLEVSSSQTLCCILVVSHRHNTFQEI